MKPLRTTIVLAQASLRTALALEFGHRINTLWVWIISLRVESVTVSSKHIISGNRDQRGATAPTRFSQIFRTEAVGCACSRRIALAAIHVGPGGAINDCVPADLYPVWPLPVRHYNVQSLAIIGTDLIAALLTVFANSLAQHAATTGHQHSQLAPTSVPYC